MYWTILFLKYLTGLAAAVTGFIGINYELNEKSEDLNAPKKLTRWGKRNQWIFVFAAPATLLLQGIQDVNESISANRALIANQERQAETLKEIRRGIFQLSDISVGVIAVVNWEQVVKDKPALKGKSNIEVVRSLDCFAIAGISPKGKETQDALVQLYPAKKLSQLQLVEADIFSGLISDGVAISGDLVLIVFPCTVAVTDSKVYSLVDFEGMSIEFELYGDDSKYIQVSDWNLVSPKPFRHFSVSHPDPKEDSVKATIPPLSQWDASG